MNNKSRRPYMLPVQLTCDPAKIENGISMDVVEHFIKKHEEMFPRYEYLEKLYLGFHDIFREPEKPDWKPDHRLAVNFPRFITQAFVGYTYGIPIKVGHEDEATNDSLQTFEKNNQTSDHNAEMATKCSVYGHAFEYSYQNEDGKTKLKAFSPKDLFVVYDNRISEKALFAVRYGYYTDDDNRRKKYGEIMTAREIVPFEENKKGEAQPNPYGYIPVVEWRLNEERMGLFEPAANLIEEFDLIISEKGNDVAAFAEAYMAILGAEVDEDGVKRIRDDRIINIYGTDDAKDVLVQFLTKPTADGTQENLLDRLQDLIFVTCMVANISDENFGNNASGISLAYKLLAMDNLAKTFDRKVSKSLSKRYKIFCSLSTNANNPNAWEDVDITFSRNVPKNLQEEVQNASGLEGIVSKKTQLTVLSVVDDPDAEMEQIRKEEDEEAEAAARRSDLWRQPSFDYGTDSEGDEADELGGDGDEA